MNREQEEFDDYWVMSGMKARVQYHANLDFKLGKNDVVIVDEADW